MSRAGRLVKGGGGGGPEWASENSRAGPVAIGAGLDQRTHEYGLVGGVGSGGGPGWRPGARGGAGLGLKKQLGRWAAAAASSCQGMPLLESGLRSGA